MITPFIFIFSSCREKAPDNKEFSLKIKKLVANHESLPVKFNPGKALLCKEWKLCYQKNERHVQQLVKTMFLGTREQKCEGKFFDMRMKAMFLEQSCIHWNMKDVFHGTIKSNKSTIKVTFSSKWNCFSSEDKHCVSWRNWKLIHRMKKLLHS